MQPVQVAADARQEIKAHCWWHQSSLCVSCFDVRTMPDQQNHLKNSAAWLQGARRLTWAEFERALALLAAEKDCQVEAVQQAVAVCPGSSHGGPVAASHVRLHDSPAHTGATTPVCRALHPHHHRLAWSCAVLVLAAMQHAVQCPRAWSAAVMHNCRPAAWAAQLQILCCCAGRAGKGAGQPPKGGVSSTVGHSSASPMR